MASSSYQSLSINWTVKYVNVIAYDVILYLDYVYNFVPIICAIIVIDRLEFCTYISGTGRLPLCLSHAVGWLVIHELVVMEPEGSKYRRDMVGISQV